MYVANCNADVDFLAADIFPPLEVPHRTSTVNLA